MNEKRDINVIFDEFEKDRISAWDIISMFQRGRDVRELEVILKEKPSLSSNILYMMSELKSEQVIPIWRSAAKFVSDDNLDSVYYALDIIHGLLPQISKEDVLMFLSEVRIREKSIDEKIQAITEALNTAE